MEIGEAVGAVLSNYPKIFFACHTRHVRDDRQGRTISAHQASIIDHLDEVERTGLTDLARHMGVTPSTMSLSIDRLERAGYVVRERDQRDGRRVWLRLTSDGGHIKEQDKVLDVSRLRSMLQRLPSDKLTRAIDGLELLGQAAVAAMHEKSEQGKAWRQRSDKRRKRT